MPGIRSGHRTQMLIVSARVRAKIFQHGEHAPKAGGLHRTVGDPVQRRRPARPGTAGPPSSAAMRSRAARAFQGWPAGAGNEPACRFGASNCTEEMGPMTAAASSMNASMP